MDYLLFRLYGPMASWGEIAIGQSRHTAIKPQKSSILGLLAASLGLQRDDDASQHALAEGYQFAFHVRSAGQLLSDYHTTQVPDSAGKFNYRTRRDEVVVGKSRLGTILSNREYRTDAVVTVAVRALADALWPLTALQQALAKPIYHLYLGRKSCPLAAPLQAEVISGKNFYEALLAYQSKSLLQGLNAWESDSRWLPDEELQSFYWEGAMDDFSLPDSVFDPSQVQQLRQHDQPRSRRRWQFEPRLEYFWQASAAEAR